jgi:membrane protease YdiL (CAAX protease family)
MSEPPAPVSPRRLALVAVFFVVVGLPLTIFLMDHARSGAELAYRAVTGVVLLVIAASLAWRGLRPK